jgi:hypothetical protein
VRNSRDQIRGESAITSTGRLAALQDVDGFLGDRNAAVLDLQSIVSLVRYVIRRNAKLGAAWQMNACRISLPSGRNGAERSTRP